MLESRFSLVLLQNCFSFNIIHYSLFGIQKKRRADNATSVNTPPHLFSTAREGFRAGERAVRRYYLRGTSAQQYKGTVLPCSYIRVPRLYSYAILVRTRTVLVQPAVGGGSSPSPLSSMYRFSRLASRGTCTLPSLTSTFQCTLYESITSKSTEQVRVLLLPTNPRLLRTRPSCAFVVRGRLNFRYSE